MEAMKTYSSEKSKLVVAEETGYLKENVQVFVAGIEDVKERIESLEILFLRKLYPAMEAADSPQSWQQERANLISHNTHLQNLIAQQENHFLLLLKEKEERLLALERTLQENADLHHKLGQENENLMMHNKDLSNQVHSLTETHDNVTRDYDGIREKFQVLNLEVPQIHKKIQIMEEEKQKLSIELEVMKTRFNLKEQEFLSQTAELNGERDAASLLLKKYRLLERKFRHLNKQYNSLLRINDMKFLAEKGKGNRMIDAEAAVSNKCSKNPKFDANYYKEEKEDNDDDDRLAKSNHDGNALSGSPDEGKAVIGHRKSSAMFDVIHRISEFATTKNTSFSEKGVGAVVIEQVKEQCIAGSEEPAFQKVQDIPVPESAQEHNSFEAFHKQEDKTIPEAEQMIKFQAPYKRKEMSIAEYSGKENNQLELTNGEQRKFIARQEKDLWRSTRSGSGKCGEDPHDDFLNTPHELALQNLQADYTSMPPAQYKDLVNSDSETCQPADEFDKICSSLHGDSPQFVPDSLTLDEVFTAADSKNEKKRLYRVLNSGDRIIEDQLVISDATSGLPKGETEEPRKTKVKGIGYKYVEAVRKKSEREELQEADCRQCKKFYDAVLAEDAHGVMAFKCEHHCAASRHRYRFLPPATPEGFWNIGFDSERP